MASGGLWRPLAAAGDERDEPEATSATTCAAVKFKCLVYARRTFSKHPQNLPGRGTQKQASRVRETHIFKTLHFPASVSSTRDAHFQNQVSSRLRETLLFLKTCCLVYAKPPLWEATLSRVHASPALLSQLEHGKSRVSCTRNVCLQKVP